MDREDLLKLTTKRNSIRELTLSINLENAEDGSTFQKTFVSVNPIDMEKILYRISRQSETSIEIPRSLIKEEFLFTADMSFMQSLHGYRLLPGGSNFMLEEE
jgi:hypothetical protein